MAMITTAAANHFNFYPNGLPPHANVGGSIQGDFPVSDGALFYGNGIFYHGGFSGIWQTLSVSSPQNIQFAWNLLTNDPFLDLGFVSIFEGTGPACPSPFESFSPCPPVQVLARSTDATIGPPTGPISVSGTYYRQTGWRTSTLALPAAGTCPTVPVFRGGLLKSSIHYLGQPYSLTASNLSPSPAHSRSSASLSPPWASLAAARTRSTWLGYEPAGAARRKGRACALVEHEAPPTKRSQAGD